jgi:hypothetical protein
MSWPTTDDPRIKFVTLRLTQGESDDLDAFAATRGESRSGAVRECVDRVIAAEKRRAKRQKVSRTPGPKMRDEDDEQDG